MQKELTKLELETRRLEIVQKEAEALINKQRSKVTRARLALQDVCPHTSIREFDESNYHRNEDWTGRECNLCKKYLGKY